jgi:hypothetical protein
VRYTGEKFYVPSGYAVQSNGVELAFSQPLERSSAENVESYAVERWNYRWTSNYGSLDYSVSNPEKQGRDTVAVKTAKLSEDGHHLFMQIPDLRPAMQMKIRYNLTAADGKAMRNEFYATINSLPRQ